MGVGEQSAGVPGQAGCHSFITCAWLYTCILRDAGMLIDYGLIWGRGAPVPVRHGTTAPAPASYPPYRPWLRAYAPSRLHVRLDSLATPPSSLARHFARLAPPSLKFDPIPVLPRQHGISVIINMVAASHTPSEASRFLFRLPVSLLVPGVMCKKTSQSPGFLRTKIPCTALRGFQRTDSPLPLPPHLLPLSPPLP